MTTTLPTGSFNLVRYFVLFCVIHFNLQLNAQTFFFDNYSVKDGLADSRVYCIMQDKNRQIWLGTKNGATKFDGVTFRNYTISDGLAPKGIFNIYQDSYGNIWFGHFDGGITRYNGSIFEKVSSDIMENKSIFSIREDDNHNIWITSEGAGTILISNPGAPIQALKYERFKGKRISDRVYGITRLSDKKYYFVTDAGVKVYNVQNNSFDNFYIKGMPVFFSITCMYEDSRNDLWFGTDFGGLYRYIRKENKFKIYDIRDGLSSNSITSILQDRRGRIWIGTRGGITIINGETLQNFSTKNGLHDNIVNCLYEDKEGNILIGTANAGFDVYKGDISLFNTPDVIPSNQVFSILEDSKKRFWLGTSYGISIYDPSASDNKKITIYKGEGLNRPTQVRYIREDQEKNIWIGTQEGIYKYSHKSQAFESPLFNLDLPRVNSITAFEIDKGILWIGTLDGLYYYNTNIGQINTIRQADGLSGNEISAIHIDKRDTKYIGARNKGLTIFNGSLNHNSPKSILLENTTPTCITADSSLNIWIGTEGRGLICLKERKVIKTYQETDGLLSNTINFVVLDKDENIFVGTNRGLNKIERETGYIRTYTKHNGFVGIQANSNAVLKDSKGKLWFGTIDGAICFDLNYDNFPQEESAPQITRFRVNLEDRNFRNGQELSYFENAVIIDYASICVNNPEAVLYQTMLEGADKTWQPPTRDLSAKYTALQPNTYTFKVKAKNNAGIWSKPITFEFRIGPPFYQTWWFITLCILTGSIILLIYIKLRERNLIKEKQILEEKVRERTAEVVAANNQLALKNRDLTDSITYASRIQNALLPPQLSLCNTFVMFRPKDIVSGDFFWFYSEGDKDWIAAVDCTGHGVPGAFMSIIGYNSLNKIIKELRITKPSDILQKLDEEVSRTLHQYKRDNQIHDGMDLALVCYDHKKHQLEYSGAFNPLWLVRGDELIEIRGNRFAIGLTPDVNKEFVNHEINIESGDSIYLFSDGYADQFGGTQAKKLKVGNFKEIILKLQSNSMPLQKEMLEEAFEKWKGDNEQVDDVLVIGWQLSYAP